MINKNPATERHASGASTAMSTVVPESGRAVRRPTGRTWKDWFGLLARQVLGWVLLVAGVLKILDTYATGVNIRAYQLGIPFEVTQFLAWAMPLFEIVVGLLLVLGLFTRFAGLMGALSMVAFVIAIASVWARGISIDCGCFGKGGTVDELNPWTYFWEIVRDVALAALGLWLVWRPRTPFSLDGWVAGPPTTLDDDVHTDDFHTEIDTDDEERTL